MDSAALEFFKKLLETPSPSGYERPVQEVVRQYIGDFADRVVKRVGQALGEESAALRVGVGVEAETDFAGVMRV